MKAAKHTSKAAVIAEKDHAIVLAVSTFCEMVSQGLPWMGSRSPQVSL